ncbi:MAG: hypothetical protein ACRDD4_12830 [Culicoidibacterales bacterium]
MRILALTVTAAPLTSFASETSNIQTRAIDYGGVGVTLPWYYRKWGIDKGNAYAASVNAWNIKNGVNIYLPYCLR